MTKKRFSFISDSEKQTIAFAHKLSRSLQRGDIVALCGELGSGKTTFVKGIAKGLKITKHINSPTFVILKVYKGRVLLYHFDLYRLSNLRELEGIGFDEFIADDAISIIEWADKIESILPKNYLKVKIKAKSPNRRLFECVSFGLRHDSLINRLRKEKKGR